MGIIPFALSFSGKYFYYFSLYRIHFIKSTFTLGNVLINTLLVILMKLSSKNPGERENAMNYLNEVNV